MKWPDLAAGFRMLKEVDLNSIRSSAEVPLQVVVLGENASGRKTLAGQLLQGPCPQAPPGIPPITEYGLDEELPLQGAGVVILLLDAPGKGSGKEVAVAGALKKRAGGLIVCYDGDGVGSGPQDMLGEGKKWGGARVVTMDSRDRKSILQALCPAMLQACKGREVQLARSVPGMREAVVQNLIDDTCFVNCAYSLTTGLAEINVFLDIPLNLADMVVLTKNQALLAYKIALAMGQPSDWKETIPRLSAVVGTAFIWRQIARQLVGLIPAYGIIPKVAVAYAGTYAVGQAVYQWCSHGEKLKPDNMKLVYRAALKRGREYAQALLAKRKAQKSLKA